MKNNLLSLTLLIALLPIAASAQTPLSLNTTYNTGFSGTTAIGAGDADPNFEITLAPAGTVVTPTPAVVAFPIPPEYATVSGAQYIAPTEDQTYNPPTAEGGDAPGSYTYQATFVTDFLLPTEVTITGSFAADDSASLSVNGGMTLATAPGFSQLTPFDDTVLVGAGDQTNTLDFNVLNGPNNVDDPTPEIGNPTALVVSDLKITPEPSSWLLMGIVLGALFVVRRFRLPSFQA